MISGVAEAINKLGWGPQIKAFVGSETCRKDIVIIVAMDGPKE